MYGSWFQLLVLGSSFFFASQRFYSTLRSAQNGRFGRMDSNTTKKMAERITSEPTVSETRFSPQKNSEFGERNELKKRFTRQESELGCPQNILLRFGVKTRQTANMSFVTQQCCFHRRRPYNNPIRRERHNTAFSIDKLRKRLSCMTRLLF